MKEKIAFFKPAGWNPLEKNRRSWKEKYGQKGNRLGVWLRIGLVSGCRLRGR
jgi:type IV secretory pathway TrbF-like protein